MAGTKKSKFLTSKYHDVIWDIIKKHKGKKSNAEIHRMLLKIDPDLPDYQSFLKFMKRYDGDVNKRMVRMAADAEEQAMNDFDLIGVGMRKALQMGNMVLGQLFNDMMERVNDGKPITKEERQEIMQYWKTGASMFYEGATLKLKGAELQKDVKVLSLLARASRSGNLEGEYIDLPNELNDELRDRQTTEISEQTVPDTNS